MRNPLLQSLRWAIVNLMPNRSNNGLPADKAATIRAKLDRLLTRQAALTAQLDDVRRQQTVLRTRLLRIQLESQAVFGTPTAKNQQLNLALHAVIGWFRRRVRVTSATRTELRETIEEAVGSLKDATFRKYMRRLEEAQVIQRFGSVWIAGDHFRTGDVVSHENKKVEPTQAGS